jgi:hypothetical protein
MTTTLSRMQVRCFNALLIMAAVYLLKALLLQWLREQGAFAVYVPPNTSYPEALRMDKAVVTALFWYELCNFLLSVGLINSLESATGLRPRVVKVVAYLLAALYTLALAGSFLSALLPRGLIG